MTPGLRNAIDAVIAIETERARLWARQLREGTLSLYDWQANMAALLKDLHVAAGLAAYGSVGGAQRTPAEYGYLGHLVKQQYGYLRSFAAELASGSQRFNGTFEVRVGLYIQAARGTYEQTVRAAVTEDGQATEERRILGIADHCPTCLEQAAQGWQPLGTLNEIGDSECLSNCHCTFDYRLGEVPREQDVTAS